MKVRISDPSFLTALVEDLLSCGCVPASVDDETVDVIYPDARDARDAHMELRFFLRAWQSRHPGVVISLGY